MDILSITIVSLIVIWFVLAVGYIIRTAKSGGCVSCQNASCASAKKKKFRNKNNCTCEHCNLKETSAKPCKENGCDKGCCR